jgi:LysM repeat protein
MGTYARSPLRFLAPVALVAFGIALLMIVSSSNGGDSGDSRSASDQEEARDLGASSKKPTRRDSDSNLPTRNYTVKRGDTLGSISEKTGIAVEKLQELNPEIDPQQLTTGQKIKLRE